MPARAQSARIGRACSLVFHREPLVRRNISSPPVRSAECCEKNSAPSSVSTMWRGLLDLLRGTATVSASPELRTSKASVCSASTCATASR